MSKLLNKDKLKEDNSYHISRIANNIATLGDTYYTETEIDTKITALEAKLMVGSANKEWVSGVLQGGQYNDEYYVSTTGEIQNINGNDFTLNFMCDVPFNSGTKQLYYDAVKIGIADSDASDYVTHIRAYRWSDYQTNSRDLDVDHSGTNGTGTGEFTFTGGPFALGSSKSLIFFVQVIATTADEFGLSYCMFRVYYDT